MNKKAAMRSEKLKKPMILIAVMIVSVLTMGAYSEWTEGELKDQDYVLAMTKVGRAVRSDVFSLLRSAVEQTRVYASDPEVIKALEAADGKKLTELANRYVHGAEVIGVVAFFDSDAGIVAMNTRDAAGKRIAEKRIGQIIGRKFTGRSIIADCLKNDTTGSLVEFQTECDFTPALFDSSGLSVAVSDDIVDAKSGKKLGVVSIRINFEKVLNLVESNRKGFPDMSVYLISGEGGYFDEGINAGKAEPPMTKERLQEYLTNFGKPYVQNIFIDEEDFHIKVLMMNPEELSMKGALYLLVYIPKK